jgi:putative transposase
MTSLPERRQGVQDLMGRGLSQRRACLLAGLNRSSWHYGAHPKNDEATRERLRALAQGHPRWGYRRAWAVLRREGEATNHKRVWRLWKQEGLCVKKRPKKRRAKTGQSVPCQATHPNHVWTCDFLYDSCLSGTKLKLLTVEDEFTRECLWIEVATSLPATKVMGVLSGLFTKHGVPRFLRSDKGPEFIAEARKDWLAGQGTGTLYIAPGSPWQNGLGESFKGKLRDQCLSAEVFVSVAEARVRVQAYRRHYNGERPHSSLGYQTPLEFKAGWFGSSEVKASKHKD